jgi:hypothetical protein
VRTGVAQDPDWILREEIKKEIGVGNIVASFYEQKVNKIVLPPKSLGNCAAFAASTLSFLEL